MCSSSSAHGSSASSTSASRSSTSPPAARQLSSHSRARPASSLPLRPLLMIGPRRRRRRATGGTCTWWTCRHSLMSAPRALRRLRASTAFVNSCPMPGSARCSSPPATAATATTRISSPTPAGELLKHVLLLLVTQGLVLRDK
jgi:hypothetical protein